MKSYLCNICNKTFGTRELIRTHLKTEHKIKGSRGKHRTRDEKREPLKEKWTTQEMV